MPRQNSPMTQPMRAVRRSVRALERALLQLAVAVQGVSAARAPASPTRKLRLSPQRRAALKLHGRYLGHIRQLKPRQKAKVQAMKAKSGYHAAIRLAKTMAG